MTTVLTATIPHVLRDDLARAAAEVRRLEDETDAARKRLVVLLAYAHAEGVPVSTLARITGRHRNTIARDLKDAED
jgi:hypothetical protein